MDESLSTRELGWVLDASPGAVRRMIRDGEVEHQRVPAGFRIPRAEVLRLARQRIEAEAGRELDDAEVERLVDDVLTTNRRVVD
jgi:hypothetical protein